jgi:methyl-accepting chemotaxis protein
VAKEIKLLISDSVDKVHEGSNLVEQAGVTMAEVVESVRRVTDITGDITAASMEQSAGIAQVSQTIVDMDQTTQQNAVPVEQAAAAAMQDQAARLARAVSVVKLGQAVAQEPSLPQSASWLALRY